MLGVRRAREPDQEARGEQPHDERLAHPVGAETRNRGDHDPEAYMGDRSS